MTRDEEDGIGMLFGDGSGSGLNISRGGMGAAETAILARAQRKHKETK